MTTSIKEYMQN